MILCQVNNILLVMMRLSTIQSRPNQRKLNSLVAETAGDLSPNRYRTHKQC